MSEHFLATYRRVADALLHEHQVRLEEVERDSLAKVIMRYRVLPDCESELLGSQAGWSELKVARTHAKALIKYASKPPSRAESVPLRCSKIEKVLSESEVACIRLAMNGIDPNALLADLYSRIGNVHLLSQLVDFVNEEEQRRSDEKKLRAKAKQRGEKILPSGIGRPWARHTLIIRSGCNAWEHAGRDIGPEWMNLDEKLVGKLPNFLRDLIACCDGTHDLVKEIAHSVPTDYKDCRPAPKGNALRRRVRDQALHDGIRAWEEWKAKIQNISS